MIFNMTGGGAAFNYRVLRSASVPAAAGKANDIAIVTSTALGDIQLNCVSAPTVRSDGTALQAGDIYIEAYMQSEKKFNALKKNALFVIPSNAFQYSGSAWARKDAYIYQNNAWTKLSLLPALGTALNSCTWDQINAVGKAGLQASYFSVGNEKTVRLTTNEVITLQIIGFAHDNLSAAGGGKAPITFATKNCLNATAQLNATNTNAGGYSGCAFYNTLNSVIKNRLPSDLRAVMKTVNKLTSAGSQSASIVTTAYNIFLLSEIEIQGSCTHSSAGEGSRYAFFTNANTRIKKVNGTANAWWTRSPNMAGAWGFCYFNEAGATTQSGVANAAFGISFGLCV